MGTLSKKPYARLILEDGTCYEGNAIGAQGTTLGELVFNTALTGYQEILTDPSYKGQVVLMTYPEIGNYGVIAEDVESPKAHAAGLVVRRLSPNYSCWRAQAGLQAYLKHHNIVGIEGVDTRAITRKIRAIGAPKVAISTEQEPLEQVLARIKALPDFAAQNFVEQVSTPTPYFIHTEIPLNPMAVNTLAVVDYGIKQSILKLLQPFAKTLVVLPSNSRFEAVMQFAPDAVFLSNGPGDPNALPVAIKLAQDVMQKNLPLMGICLGHQIISIACGAKVVKMPFGHHGGNHPVRDLLDEINIITSQNHSYAVDEQDFPEKMLQVTHVNLNDRTIEGICHRSKPVASIQFHPEAGPGPHDGRYLFEQLFKLACLQPV